MQTTTTKPNKPQHTAGPWKADNADDTFGDHNITKQDGSEGLSAIAAVVSNGRPAEEVQANANLVAAAPDLLEALEIIMDDFRIVPKSALHSPSCMATVSNAVAAIAKARGRA